MIESARRKNLVNNLLKIKVRPETYLEQSGEDKQCPENRFKIAMGHELFFLSRNTPRGVHAPTRGSTRHQVLEIFTKSCPFLRNDGEGQFPRVLS